MTNPVSKAIVELKYCIPKAILNKAFLTKTFDWRQTVATNIDEQIMVNVIRPRILVDCNLVGGTHATITLEGLRFDKPNNYTTVIHIPKNRTQGRSINSVLDVAFLNQNVLAGYGGAANTSINNAYNPSDNSTAMQAAIGAMSAVDKIPVVSTSNVQLISENTIMIRDVVIIPTNGYLRCVLANDENLNHLQPRSYKAFSKLVEYAVKSYIYNELVVELDTAELQGGQQLGVFKNIIDSYSDAEQNYKDYLKDNFEAVLVMNDAWSYNRYLKLAIGGNR